MSGKRLTISSRWRLWAQASPIDFWASHVALASFLVAMVGLYLHLFVWSGFWRTFGLCLLIGGDSITLGITAWRKRWWWHNLFWYITVGVIGWEIASYFFGSRG